MFFRKQGRNNRASRAGKTNMAKVKCKSSIPLK